MLKELAGRLRAATRRGDVVARYGGEEFVVLLPSTSWVVAGEVAERIRTDVCDVPFAVEGGTLLAVTVSVGVAVAEPGDSVADLLGTADRRLYEAKGNGRNRVVTGRLSPAAG